MFLFINLFVLNFCNLVNDGVLLNMFIIFKLVFDGFGGVGLLFVFFCLFLKELNFFFV